MNPLAAPDVYVSDVFMSVLGCSVAAVSALLSIGVVVYIAMVVELLRRPVHRLDRHWTGAGRRLDVRPLW